MYIGREDIAMRDVAGVIRQPMEECGFLTNILGMF
jgi:hypothetical protein